MDKKIGIIDLGSNSVRLVIYEITQSGAYRLVDDISDTIRLSENMNDGKFLSDIAMRKALKTIKLFQKLCLAYNIPSMDIMAVATAAVRKAENRDQFLKIIYASTGITFRILTGEEEALYVYKAVAQTMDISDGIIVDIGGGSTEIIKFRDKSVVNYTSIPIGAVVATQEYLDKDIISPEKLGRLEQGIQSILSGLGWLDDGNNHTIIGLGGTIRNLSKIHRRKVNYPLDLTHNYHLEMNEFYDIYNNLKGMDLKARRKMEGMSSNRADIIIGGLAILKTIASYTGSKQLVTSGNGLREGVLIEYLLQNKPAKKLMDVLNFSIDNYLNLYSLRQEHAYHVSSLALSLFDQLKPLHKLDSEARKILKVASLLHDIGIAISYYGHQNHSFYMILNLRLNGLSHREIVLVAAIAALHGKDKLKDDWEKQYKKILLSDDGEMVRKLAAFLKVAECLDRGETGSVEAIECSIGDDIVRVSTYFTGDAELEINLANDNNETFKKVFNRLLVIT